jgi:hypothetical protein
MLRRKRVPDLIRVDGSSPKRTGSPPSGAAPLFSNASQWAFPGAADRQGPCTHKFGSMGPKVTQMLRRESLLTIERRSRLSLNQQTTMTTTFKTLPALANRDATHVGAR